ncbi:MAG: cytochrome b/b6 domain-containing protein [Dehalococcoidia bacterium]|nr:cytochrome b/b6 domain-containing protein [Dehalococcoidia bacterium]
MSTAEERTIERFRKRTIWFHWINTAAFVTLLITGMFLFLPGLGVVAQGGITRVIHRIAAVIFVLGPIVYFFTNPRMSLHFIKETLTWGKDDFNWMKAAPDYYFGGDETKMPPQGHVNTGQKMWQGVVIGTFILFVATGTIMWFFKGEVSSEVFQWCLVIHDLAFIAGITMLLVHIYLGAIHPRMTESMRSMLDGKISKHYAKSHYGKWYDSISSGGKH